jgi:hypothetical protein
MGGTVVRRIGYTLVGVGLILFAAGILPPLFNAGGSYINPVDAVPLDEIFPWLVTNTFIILFGDDSTAAERSTAGGLLLITMGICFIIIGMAAGAFGKKADTPAPPAVEPPR